MNPSVLEQVTSVCFKLYLPGDSIHTDVVRLLRHLIPEGLDIGFVLSSETGHLACWLSVAECFVAQTTEVFIVKTKHGHTRDHLQDRLQRAFPVRLQPP